MKFFAEYCKELTQKELVKARDRVSTDEPQQLQLMPPNFRDDAEVMTEFLALFP